MEYVGLSKRQSEILDFFKNKTAEQGYPPSVREIAEAIGLSSPATVHAHLAVIEQKGYIKRDKSKQRAVEIILDSPSGTASLKEMVDIPIIGKISAGTPILAEENFEDTFPVPLSFVQSNQQLFMVRVAGDSMIEVGIHTGDLLIVEQTPVVNNGQIAVALIDDEVTVKTFYKENGYIRLQPENKAMEPIIVSDCKILGRVIGLFRRF